MALKGDELQYFFYYLRHTRYVVLAWKDIQDILIGNGIINEKEFDILNKRIPWHDQSKMEAEEFAAYAAKFYPLTKPIDPQEIEKIRVEFKKAWEHHKASNLHHHQSLKNYIGDDWRCYIVEMVCDWIAMGWETKSYVCDYYEQNKETIELPLEYRNLLEMILNLIKTNSCHANSSLSEDEAYELEYR